MRATFTILLFIAVLGLAFSSVAADAPIAGVDYDVRPSAALECQGEDIPGEGWLSRTAGVPGQREHAADLPDSGISVTYRKMMCLLLDR